MAGRTRQQKVVRTRTRKLGNGRIDQVTVEIRDQVARGVVLLQISAHPP